MGVDTLEPLKVLGFEFIVEDEMEESDIAHVVCCIDESQALCGTELPEDAEECDCDDGDPCVVCEDLWESPACPRGYGMCPVEEYDDDEV